MSRETRGPDMDAVSEAHKAAPRNDVPRCPARRTAKGATKRQALIAERVARVHAGAVATFSVDAVEQSLRSELDF